MPLLVVYHEFYAVHVYLRSICISLLLTPTLYGAHCCWPHHFTLSMCFNLSLIHFAEEIRKELTGCIYLEDKGTKVFGLNIYGTPWQPEFCGWAFNLPRGMQWASCYRIVEYFLTIFFVVCPWRHDCLTPIHQYWVQPWLLAMMQVYCNPIVWDSSVLFTDNFV